VVEAGLDEGGESAHHVGGRGLNLSAHPLQKSVQHESGDDLMQLPGLGEGQAGLGQLPEGVGVDGWRNAEIVIAGRRAGELGLQQ
jgi:hypothetical protein